MKPALSIIIVTYNSAYAVEGALKSVAEHLPAARVIVVDNGSTDSTLEVVTRWNAATIVQGHGNVGFGQGVNLGMKACTTDVALVLNPDVAVTRVDEAALMKLTERRPLGLVGFRLITHHGSQPIIIVRWGWWRELLWIVTSFFLKPNWLRRRRPGAGSDRPGWVCGAAFMAASEDWRYVDGFHPDLFLYYEDLDLSRRYLSKGLPLVASDAIVFEHVRNEAERGVNFEVTVSWVFRSLVQLAAIWDGPTVALRIARAIIVALNAIEVAGLAASMLPGLRSVAGKKAASAGRVRRLLLDDPSVTAAAGHYKDANAIFERLARAVERS